jgi:hypothetical protein
MIRTISELFSMFINILIITGGLYIVVHIIALLMLTGIMISSIPYSYCMCHLDWEQNEFTRTIEHFRGYGGITTHTRPEVCGYLC